MDGDGGLIIHSRLTLPAGELVFQAVRAGGPGGQNVNKVATKVILRFDVRASRALSDPQRARIEAALGTRLTNKGELVVQAARHRAQAQNKEEARRRLAELLRAALTVRKTRRPTRPTRASGERRLAAKRRRSDSKRSRGEGAE